jgi:16S rRNA (adenine1518-N6/adenine1519-N6)-dimethyltransferase
MQNKSEIQQLLAMAGVRPNKRLGQHFLIDLNLMNKLIEAADIHSDDVVLEVGCGTGSLTQELAERAGKVIAVEIDRTLAEITIQLLADYKNVIILNTDVLENKHTISPDVTNALESVRKDASGRFLLVANLPYNAASGLMMNLITAPPDSPLTPDAMYVTIQKEVAQRMTAKPGSKDYGTLSIFLDATGDVKLLRTLKPTVFWPQPQVNSAMISYVHSKEKIRQISDMEIFSSLVGLFMQHRRKMLKATARLAAEKLAKIDWPVIFEKCGIDPQKRPENLTPEDYITLANICSKTS